MTENQSNPQRREHIWLQPIAAPSILGLYGFAGATFMVGAWMAHWYGTAFTPVYLFPFAAIFGGLAQFSAGMWAYKARDGLATAMHGLWGSFWLAFGVLHVTMLVAHLQPPTGAWPELGFWFIVLAAITWAGMFAALGQSIFLALVLLFLAAGSSAAAAGYLAGSTAAMILAGWLFVISACIAWYCSTAMMMKSAFGRDVWGVGKTRTVKEMPPIVAGTGEPGVIRGQA